MTKDEKIHAKRVEHFNRCYGAIHTACQLVEAMADEKGQVKEFDRAKVNELQTLLKDAGCAANAVTATFDGLTSPPENC